jgi:hypothetical protein
LRNFWFSFLRFFYCCGSGVKSCVFFVRFSSKSLMRSLTVAFVFYWDGWEFFFFFTPMTTCFLLLGFINWADKMELDI